MKILITGASGFVGRHLVPHLRAKGHDVEGWSRDQGVDLLEGALPAPASPWDAALHLAGHSQPGVAWSQDLVQENLRMTARLLEHLRRAAPACRVLVTSSAHVYAPSEAPLREDAPLDPRSPYGQSKLLCEEWCLAQAREQRVGIIRPFNQVGPGMPPRLLIPELLERIRSGESPLRMRGRDDVRDFLDVRDAVEAYAALLELDFPSGRVWNLCSGRGLAVSSLIGAILDGLGDRREATFADPRVETLVGYMERLHEDTGWSPRRSLVETVSSLLEAAAP